MRHDEASADSETVERLRTLRDRLRSTRGFDLEHLPLRLALDYDTLEIDGEVPSIAIKRRAVQMAAGSSGVRWVVDKLRVSPASPMTDAVIRDHVVNSLSNELAFAECAISRLANGRLERVREPVPARGEIRVIVDDGVVTLDGDVPTRAHKRLAGVLAWWVPGTRDVIDGLGVLSPEQDNDHELADAVRTALEKDPFVNAGQVQVRTNDGRVTLSGLVSSHAERDMAENDAWYVFGVSDVVNELDVAKPA